MCKTFFPRRISGALKEAVEHLVRRCCGRCTKFKYLAPSPTLKVLTASMVEVEHSHIHLPVVGKISDDRFLAYPFFSVVEPAGRVFFQREKNAQQVCS